MSLDLGRLEPLRERDYVLFVFDSDVWVPMQVLRRRIRDFPYSFAKNISGFNGAAASTWKNLAGGAENMPTLANAPANSFVQSQSLNMQAVSGVTDILQIQQDYEILQCWYGIAPSPLRVWLQQPPTQYDAGLDNNLYPLSLSGQLLDVSLIDGFESPYERPSPLTEFFSFKNIQVQFSVANPVPEQIAPRLKFVINQMQVTPVTDPATLRGLFGGRIPCAKKTIGQPMQAVSWSGAGYGGIQGLPSNLDKVSDSVLASVLDKQGYAKIGGG